MEFQYIFEDLRDYCIFCETYSLYVRNAKQGERDTVVTKFLPQGRVKVIITQWTDTEETEFLECVSIIIKVAAQKDSRENS